MHRPPHLDTRQRRILYLGFLLLWMTGVAWMIIQYVLKGTPEEPSALQPLMLKAHGAAAMLFLISFGAILFQHIPAGWKRIPHRQSGLTLVSLCGLLVVTGWGLYYLGSESLRNVTGIVHAVVGVLVPLAIWLHVRLRSR